MEARERPQLDVVERLDQTAPLALPIVLDVASNDGDRRGRGWKARTHTGKKVLHDIQIANSSERAAQVPAELDLIRIGRMDSQQRYPNAAQCDPCLVNAFHIGVADTGPGPAHEREIVE